MDETKTGLYALYPYLCLTAVALLIFAPVPSGMNEK